MLKYFPSSLVLVTTLNMFGFPITCSLVTMVAGSIRENKNNTRITEVLAIHTHTHTHLRETSFSLVWRCHFIFVVGTNVVKSSALPRILAEVFGTFAQGILHACITRQFGTATTVCFCALTRKPMHVQMCRRAHLRICRILEVGARSSFLPK